MHLDDGRIRVTKNRLLGRCWKILFRFSVDETCDRGLNSVVLLRQRNFVGLMKCLGYDSSLWKAGQTGFDAGCYELYA